MAGVGGEPTISAQKIAEGLKARLGNLKPKLMIICGSGLGGLATTIEEVRAVPYVEIGGFPPVTVAGHKGELAFGKISGVEVMCMVGRFHSYEGHSMQMCTLPVRVAAYLGVEYLIVTNAAGGLNKAFSVGDVMIMSDHIFFPGMAGRHPLVGANDAGPNGDWPRFPAMSDAYDPALASICWNAAKEEGMMGFTHKIGTYAMVSGPSYETSAECRFLKQGGADAVGMSTAPEVIVARHCGMRVLGLSLITNKAIMDTDSNAPKANHAEVLEAVESRCMQMQGLVRRVVKAIHENEEASSPSKKQRVA